MTENEKQKGNLISGFDDNEDFDPDEILRGVVIDSLPKKAGYIPNVDLRTKDQQHIDTYNQLLSDLPKFSKTPDWWPVALLTEHSESYQDLVSILEHAPFQKTNQQLRATLEHIPKNTIWWPLVLIFNCMEKVADNQPDSEDRLAVKNEAFREARDELYMTHRKQVEYLEMLWLCRPIEYRDATQHEKYHQALLAWKEGQLAEIKRLVTDDELGRLPSLDAYYLATNVTNPSNELLAWQQIWEEQFSLFSFRTILLSLIEGGGFERYMDNFLRKKRDQESSFPDIADWSFKYKFFSNHVADMTRKLKAKPYLELLNEVLPEMTILSELSEPSNLFMERHIGALKLSGLNLDGASFNGADGNQVFIKNSKLRKASFIEARLEEARFYGSDLGNTDFSNADCRGADFESGKEETYSSEFEGADFRFLDDRGFENEVLFTNADCSGADFTKRFMKDWSFEGAQLVKALFINCRFNNVDFSDADLTGAQFSLFYQYRGEDNFVLLSENTIMQNGQPFGKKGTFKATEVFDFVYERRRW